MKSVGCAFVCAVLLAGAMCVAETPKRKTNIIEDEIAKREAELNSLKAEKKKAQDEKQKTMLVSMWALRKAVQTNLILGVAYTMYDADQPEPKSEWISIDVKNDSSWQDWLETARKLDEKENPKKEPEPVATETPKVRERHPVDHGWDSKSCTFCGKMIWERAIDWDRDITFETCASESYSMDDAPLPEVKYMHCTLNSLPVCPTCAVEYWDKYNESMEKAQKKFIDSNKQSEDDDTSTQIDCDHVEPPAVTTEWWRYPMGSIDKEDSWWEVGDHSLAITSDPNRIIGFRSDGVVVWKEAKP